MTSLYGSIKVPEELFGEGTPELRAFYKALWAIAPGASTLIQVFKDAWQADALDHSWVMPDYHHVRLPVEQTVETRIEIDEMKHHKFTYLYSENIGQEKGVSLIANVTHSIDAYLLRTLIRRCNYDPIAMNTAAKLIQSELLDRNMYGRKQQKKPATVHQSVEGIPRHTMAINLLQQYKATHIADMTILDYLDDVSVRWLSVTHLRALQSLIVGITVWPPFEVICVHDEFKCHANNMGQLREHYRQIMAELADSNILNAILSDITGKTYKLKKFSQTLGKSIRQSHYAIC